MESAQVRGGGFVAPTFINPDEREDETRVVKRQRYLFDADHLDCPICTLSLSSPVFQCENGYIACLACCKKVETRGCSYCKKPIGKIRVRVIENIIESLQERCIKGAAYGCNEMVKWRNEEMKKEHEFKCKFMSCPAVGCKYSGSISDYPFHFYQVHAAHAGLPAEETKIEISLQLYSTERYVLLKADHLPILLRQKY